MSKVSAIQPACATSNQEPWSGCPASAGCWVVARSMGITVWLTGCLLTIITVGHLT